MMKKIFYNNMRLTRVSEKISKMTLTKKTVSI